MTSDPPAVPVAATYAQAAQILTVAFSLPLTANPALVEANWPACLTGLVIDDWVNVASAANTVTAQGPFMAPACAGDRGSYLAAPPDLLDVLGRQIPPFADYPVTLLP